MPKAGYNPRRIHDKLLKSLEFTLAAGWYTQNILSSDRQQFRGAIAELHAAEHFLLRGYELEPEPRFGRRQSDLRVNCDDVNAIVEVAAPIELKALSDFFVTSTDVAKRVDVALDYRGHIEMAQLNTFNEQRELCT